MFYCDTPQNPTSGCNFSIPIIDLKGVHTKVVNQIQKASEECGFFQVINHGIPVDLLERMIDGVCCFNEQDVEVQRQFYTHGNTKFYYHSNSNLFTNKFANWRDTLGFAMAPNPPKPEELPEICR
jgi:isopenicillin N synthase-like dioxygenase